MLSLAMQDYVAWFLSVCTWTAGKDLSNEEGLGQEALDLAGTGHSQLVLLTQLIHTQDGNNILQILVGLQGPTPDAVHIIGTY